MRLFSVDCDWIQLITIVPLTWTFHAIIRGCRLIFKCEQRVMEDLVKVLGQVQFVGLVAEVEWWPAYLRRWTDVGRKHHADLDMLQLTAMAGRQSERYLRVKTLILNPLRKIVTRYHKPTSHPILWQKQKPNSENKINRILVCNKIL